MKFERQSRSTDSGSLNKRRRKMSKKLINLFFFSSIARFYSLFFFSLLNFLFKLFRKYMVITDKRIISEIQITDSN